jgi:serine/threonine protein kinase
MSTPSLDTTFALPEPSVPGVELGGLLGQGGFGVVREGQHRSLGVRVAVKISPGAALHGASFDRALREARLMARLDHPNLLRIYDAGTSGDALYLVLEHMDGGTLEVVHGASEERLIDLARQLLSGLGALHDARIVHRDIKPSNVLLRARDGRAKLADLGISIDQTAGESRLGMAGTLPFMAPELLRQPPEYGVRSDLYALGLTLACAALDRPPFPDGSSMSEMLRWIEGPPPDIRAARPDLPASLLSLVERLIARSPADRPESAARALAMLDRGVEVLDKPEPGAGPTDAARVGPWVLGALDHESDNWCVYAASHRRTGLAVRFCHMMPGAPLGPGKALLERACELASGFDHQALPGVLDWGYFARRFFAVTPPRGRLLRDAVEASGPLDEATVLTLGASLADGLAWLHQRGVVYQLVVPASVGFSQDVRSAQLGWPLFSVPAGCPATAPDGTTNRVFLPSFAPPELFDEPPSIEPSIDLYGLGDVLFFALTGEQAFGPDLARSLKARRAGPPSVSENAPEVTRPTAKLVEALLHPDPERRPRTAVEVRDRLRLLASRFRPPVAGASSG